MSEIPERPADTTDHTTWEWNVELGQWVERELTEEELLERNPPIVIPPRPPDTLLTTWDWGGTAWVERLWTAEELETLAMEEERKLARETIKGIVIDLQAEKDRAQSVIDNPASTPREKDLGRACKRIADAVIELARYVG